MQEFRFKAEAEKKKLDEEATKADAAKDELDKRMAERHEKDTATMMQLGMHERNTIEEKEAADRMHARLIEEASIAEHNMRVKKLEMDLAIERMRYLKMPEDQIARAMAEEDRVIGEMQRKIDKIKAQEAGLPGGEATRKATEKAKDVADTDAAADKAARAMAKIHSIGQQIKATFNESLQHISKAFSSAISSWIEGSERFGTAMAKMARQMAIEFISKLIEMAIQKFIIDKLIHVSTATTGEAAVLTHSAVSGAETTAYYAAYDPPMAIPAGLAMMAASIAAFSVPALGAAGGLTPKHMNPSGGLAVLHQNELVLPSHITDKVLNMTGDRGQTYNINYQGYQGQSKESMRSDSKQIYRAVQREMRRQNVSQPSFGY
jgi:hypothetical protein